MATLRDTEPQMGFHVFNFDITTSESNVASEMELLSSERFKVGSIVVISAWTTAALGFQGQFSGESPAVWRTVEFNGDPLKISVPSPDDFMVIPEQIAVLMSLQIIRLRLTSIDDGTDAAINQTAARVVNLYLGR